MSDQESLAVDLRRHAQLYSEILDFMETGARHAGQATSAGKAAEARWVPVLDGAVNCLRRYRSKPGRGMSAGTRFTTEEEMLLRQNQDLILRILLRDRQPNPSPERDHPRSAEAAPAPSMGSHFVAELYRRSGRVPNRTG